MYTGMGYGAGDLCAALLYINKRENNILVHFLKQQMQENGLCEVCGIDNLLNIHPQFRWVGILVILFKPLSFCVVNKKEVSLRLKR